MYRLTAISIIENKEAAMFIAIKYPANIRIRGNFKIVNKWRLREEASKLKTDISAFDERPNIRHVHLK